MTNKILTNKILLVILIFAFFFAALFVSSAHGQSVTPLVVECGSKCKGSFTVSNDGVQPMSVVVEPYTFTLSSDGQTEFHPLDPSVQVAISETSTRVGPHDAHDFDYDIHCVKRPCLVAVTTGMVVGRTKEGIVLRLVIPHIVYVCDKAHDCRKGVRHEAGLQ
jgi:hypothetical protein